MARPSTSQITLSGLHQTGLPPRAIRDDDARLTSPGVAGLLLGAYWRSDVPFTPAAAVAPQWLRNGTPAALTATTLPEYVVPNFVFTQPGPAIEVVANRVKYFSFKPASDPSTRLDVDPGDTVPAGDFWLYIAVLADGSFEQRVRIGTPPIPDDVRASWYWIDPFSA